MEGFCMNEVENRIREKFEVSGDVSPYYITDKGPDFRTLHSPSWLWVKE